MDLIALSLIASIITDLNNTKRNSFRQLSCMHALHLEEIPVYGNGMNIRDWIYVTDHCEAIDAIYHRGAHGSTYNIGGRTELRNLDLVNNICARPSWPRPEIRYRLFQT